VRSELLFVGRQKQTQRRWIAAVALNALDFLPFPRTDLGTCEWELKTIYSYSSKKGKNSFYDFL